MFQRFIFFSVVLLLAAGCARLPQVELETTRSEVAQAYASGAKILAPVEYEAASAALHDAEMLVSSEEYSRAHEVLELALLHAAKASALSHAKTAALEVLRKTKIKTHKVKKKPVKKTVNKKPRPRKPKVIPKKPKVILRDQVTVADGETLFSLSGRVDVYGDPLLWTLIYKANRDQIKDPQKIFKGQIFTIPRNKTTQEQNLARKEARDSRLFRQ